MKIYFMIPLFIFVILNAAACSDKENPAPEKKVQASKDAKILIAYFSYPEPSGVDAVSGASRLIDNNVMLGSTQYIAQIIHDATKGDIFPIETVQQYPAAHKPLIDQASEEKKAGARPPLKTSIKNLDQYDIIFIGYPNWWADLPMPLYTFLEKYDFSGKTIIPFNTHGGSGLSDTVNTIKRLQPKATVTRGFTVYRSGAGNAKNDVFKWLNEIGIDINQ